MQGLPKFQVVVWMNQPSHYQTVFFRELRAQTGGRIAVIYDADLASDRRALGWQSVREEQYQQHFLQGWLDAVVKAWNHRDAVHMVNGLWSVWRFLPAALLLLLNGSLVYFHSECPDPDRPRNRFIDALKRLWIRWVFMWSAGIFVIGKRAAQHYSAMGVPSNKIFPFLYCTEVIRGATGPVRGREAPRVLYVGQFIPRKDVETLLRAFAVLRGEFQEWQLRLVGAGPLRERYQQLGEQLALGRSLEILAASSPAEIVTHMQDSRLVVLPSRFDGWGLVVNEALQLGVPAVASNGCGASQLLTEQKSWGGVFTAGDSAGLAASMRQIMKQDPADLLDRRAIEAKIGKSATVRSFVRQVDSDLTMRCRSRLSPTRLT